MIALSTTYGANHKALDFIKKNFTTINDIDFTTQKIIDEIYNTSDTMDRIILGYSQYLDHLENMINKVTFELVKHDYENSNRDINRFDYSSNHFWFLGSQCRWSV